MRLSWIIVSHQSASDLERFLPSLTPVLECWRRAGVSCELIIIDNASTDESVAMSRRLAPEALIIESAQNVGYGPAINTAVRRARGEWLVIGNADLEVPAGGLDGLPKLLAALPADVALAGPTLLDIEGRPTLSAGFFPTMITLVQGLVRKCRDRKYLPPRRHVAGAVDWVTGACLFARRDQLRRAGGFDDEFFLYYEDVDLAQRLARAGLRCMYTPTMRVVHLSPHHVRPPQAQIEAIVRASRKAYFAKHRPVWEQRFLSLLGKLEPIFRRPSGLDGHIDSPASPPLVTPSAERGAALSQASTASGQGDVAESGQPARAHGRARAAGSGAAPSRDRELALAEVNGVANGRKRADS
ncbi:MAG: N-acetylglucosaminyl-diphospho-decaprenol L-rhamnosyltransferase [Pseudohongiellaceae bacterium]|jgi:N-acetylglucosaminyl-diphospho-decaprenol L-rhamnosyltransferase